MKKANMFLIGMTIGALAGIMHVSNASSREPVFAERTVIKNYECASSNKVYVKQQVFDDDIPKNVQISAEFYGKEYGICPELLEAIAFYESSYQEGATNGNCIGLMQINVDAQKDRLNRLDINESEILKADKNMKVACDLLSELFEKHEDVGVVLMLYNGDSRVWEFEKEGKISKYAEKILELSSELEEEHEEMERNAGGYYVMAKEKAPALTGARNEIKD